MSELNVDDCIENADWIKAAAKRRAAAASARADYDAGEPRKGKGPGGGEWTSGGAGGAKGGDKPVPKWSENLPHKDPAAYFGGTEILPDQSGVYHVGKNLDAAVELLGRGKDVDLKQPREVATLMDKLAAIGREAANGVKRVYDLCHVTVANTNLFCVEHVGIPRAKMPQLKGVPAKGSRGAELEPNKKGEVDLSKHFRHHLEKHGYDVLKATEDASYLRASQRELDGVKIAGMMQAIKEGKVPDNRIWVTRDNYVLDGHHRWAAQVALEYIEGKPIPMKVFKVDMSITDAIRDANHFAAKWGIAQQAVGAPSPKAKADSVCTSCGAGVRSDSSDLSKVDEILTHLKAGEILSELKKFEK